MKSKISAFVLILLLIVGSVWAEIITESSTMDLSVYEPKTPYSEFTIKAYKNTPDPVTIKVYDALTISLDEISSQHNTIMITPFLESFLGTGITKINDPAKQILFSFIVTGASTGSFNTTVTVSNFVGPYTPTTPATTTPTGRINAYYALGEVDYLFSKSQQSQTDYFEIIGDPAPTEGIATSETQESVSFSINWTIQPRSDITLPPGSSTHAIGEYWMATGSLMMQLDTDTFKNSSTGDYRATVEVKLAPIP